MNNLEERIKELNTKPSFWYQKIRLGSHTTPGRTDPEEKWDKLIKPNLPFPVKGKSVLDVGCNAGAHCLRCIDDGATKVTGVEIDNVFRAQAELILSVKMAENDNYNRVQIVKSLDDVQGEFDIALVFNVLYWVGWNTQLDEGNPRTPPMNGAWELSAFLNKLSRHARTAYVIGSNTQRPRRAKRNLFTGGTTLAENVKYIDKDWVIGKAYQDNSYRRNHCIIHARSKNL